MISGDVRWDYLTMDEGSQRLFITHGNQVDVFDTRLKKVTGIITGTAGVHGVTLAPEFDRGYTSDGTTSTVTVFELSTLKSLGTLPTEKKPDAIVYDPKSKRVFVANGDSGTLTVIDATSSKVVGTVQIGGKLEFQAVDGNGLLYVNVEDRNVLAVVDTASLTVVAQHDISSACEAPTGLSIDRATHRLFVGCRDKKMAIVSGSSGKVLASVPVGKGCDATAYDPASNVAFASAGDRTLTVVSGVTYAVLQVVPTLPTARTMALDSSTHTVYVVAAELEPPMPPATRAKLKAGTFTLLTIAR
jgi:YVTN family beta-propeller protein